jgi:DMSO/TMAO reductase YedYZ molybdopterin-dependent catalytic subunit
VRLRIPTQLAYKSTKWVQRIEVVASFQHIFGGRWLLGRQWLRVVRRHLKVVETAPTLRALDMANLEKGVTPGDVSMATYRGLSACENSIVPILQWLETANYVEC